MPEEQRNEPFYESDAYSGIDVGKDYLIGHVPTELTGVRLESPGGAAMTVGGYLVSRGFAIIGLAQALDADSDPWNRVAGALDAAEVVLGGAAEMLGSIAISEGGAWATAATATATAGAAAGGAGLVMTLFSIMGKPYADAGDNMRASGVRDGTRLGVSAAILGMTPSDFRNEVRLPFNPLDAGDTFEQSCPADAQGSTPVRATRETAACWTADQRCRTGRRFPPFRGVVAAPAYGAELRLRTVTTRGSSEL
jgi:hypothetical protein